MSRNARGIWWRDRRTQQKHEIWRTTRTTELNELKRTRVALVVSASVVWQRRCSITSKARIEARKELGFGWPSTYGMPQARTTAMSTYMQNGTDRGTQTNQKDQIHFGNAHSFKNPQYHFQNHDSIWKPLIPATLIVHKSGNPWQELYFLTVFLPKEEGNSSCNVKFKEPWKLEL